MTHLFRWMLRVFLTLAALATLEIALIWYLATRSLPDYDADYSVAGISAPVEVVRNNAAIPHIFARQDQDAWFALGFVHAQDRLWQMVLSRRTVQGRLSEVFGTDTVATDQLLRRLDLYRLSQRSLAAMQPETLTVLEAYSAGVNARISTINSGSLGRGAPEFFLFPGAIEAWSPADSVALIKLMALRFSPHMENEVLRARLAVLLRPEQLADIMPDVPGPALAGLAGRTTLKPVQPLWPADSGTDDSTAAWRIAGMPRSPDLRLSPFPARGFAGASNAFAAAPARSAAGATLLANDPHFSFSAPSIWYLARLEFAEGGLIGATIPGVPAVLSGRSDYLGWGITASYLDDLDIFIEELNPQNPNEYLTPQGYRAFRSRRETIAVKDAPNVEITLRWSDNGPIMPPSHYNVGAVTPPGHVASLAWTVLSPNDTTIEAAIGINRAQSIAAAISAGEGFIAPSLNLTLVDGQQIAMKTLGAFPDRNPAQIGQGRIPALGARPENRWRGRLPYAENPEFTNPADGILGNTNNKLTDLPFPRHMSFLWGDSQRVLRWRHLMQNRAVHTRESFIEVQLDEVSNAARTLLALVGAELWFTGDPAPAGTLERERQTTLELLSVWNGEMNQHLPEPLLYAAWMRHLQDRLIRDELGTLADRFTHVEPLFIERVFRNIDGAGRWCDIVQSAVTETCTDIARAALDDALLWIKEEIGGRPESLRWGDQHEARQDHTVLGNFPGLGWVVNIRQSSSGGDQSLMRGRTLGTGPNPYYNVHGAGYRGVYDMADPDSSVFVLSTGQSGHPLSRFYDNLGELWRRGEYIPMSLDPALARAANAGVMVLTPTP